MKTKRNPESLSLDNIGSLSISNKKLTASKLTGFVTFKGRPIKKNNDISFEKAIDISLKKHKKLYDKLSKL